jgi:hypothetical protein
VLVSVTAPFVGLVIVDVKFVVPRSVSRSPLAAGRPSVYATEGKSQRGGLGVVKG